MSYSIQTKGATKALARAAAIAEFDRVCVSQPAHRKDREAVIANASAAIDLLDDAECEGKDIGLHLNGSVGWQSGSAEDPVLISVGINAQAYLMVRQSAQQ